MKFIVYLFAYFFVCVGSAVAAAPPYVRNDTLSTTINSENLFPGSASVASNGAMACNLVATDFGASGAVRFEDAASSSGHSGVAMIGVRVDAPAVQTSATADYGFLTIDSLGRNMTAFAPNGVLSRACSTAATGTADTTILNNPGGAIRYYITSIGCSNNSAVPSEITFEEGGSSVLWKGAIPALANGGNLQIDFGNAPLKTGANTTFTFVMTTTATSTTCCANAYQIID